MIDSLSVTKISSPAAEHIITHYIQSIQLNKKHF